MVIMGDGSCMGIVCLFFFSSRRRHTRLVRDWSSDVCSSDLVDLIYEGGIANMNYSISNTAEYGEYVSGKKIIDNKTKERMKEILKDIQSGKFAKQWMDECKNGQKNFLKMRKELSEHPIEKVGKKLRELMPWIGKNKLVEIGRAHV